MGTLVVEKKQLFFLLLDLICVYVYVCWCVQLPVCVLCTYSH